MHALTPEGEKRLGSKELWSLTEYSDQRSKSAQNRVHRSDKSLILGHSSFEYTPDGLKVIVSEATKPFFQKMSSKVEGEITLQFKNHFNYSLDLDHQKNHHWMGVSPISRISVDLDSPRLHFTGHAYHDSNWGNDSLESAFQSWTWSRAELDEGTLVMYDAVEKDSTESHRALLFQKGGTVIEPSAFKTYDLSPGFWGVNRSTRADLGAQGTKVVHNLVDSPFYTRDVIQTTLCQHTTLAVHESLNLNRFQSPWVRFLLPFRIRRS